MVFKADFSTYEYTALPSTFDEAALNQYVSQLLQSYDSQTKLWNKEKNAEWLVRTYLAMKMIFAATLMLNTLKYSKTKNIKIVEPYLTYYGLFCCCRAVVLTLPELLWDNGELAKISHSKALKRTIATLNTIEKNEAAEVRRILHLSRSFREIFSYKFPSRGLSVIPEKFRIRLEEIVQVCTLLCEIAQLNSECLEASIVKNVRYDPAWEKDIDEQFYLTCWEYEFDDGEFKDVAFDDYDWYRFGRMEIKNRVPFSLRNSMSEGMADDFFEAWATADDKESEAFELSSPCPEWGIIFPIP